MLPKRLCSSIRASVLVVYSSVMSRACANVLRADSLRAFVAEHRPTGMRWTFVTMKEALRQSGWQFGNAWLAKTLASHCPGWRTERSGEQMVSELRRILAQDVPPGGWTVRKVEVAMRRSWGPIRNDTVRAALREHCPDWKAKRAEAAPELAAPAVDETPAVATAAPMKKVAAKVGRAKEKARGRSETAVHGGDLLSNCKRILAGIPPDGKAWTKRSVGRALRETWGPIGNGRLLAFLRANVPDWYAAPAEPDLLLEVRRVLAECPPVDEAWALTTVGWELRRSWGPVGNDRLLALLQQHCPSWNEAPDKTITDDDLGAALQEVLQSQDPPGRFWTMAALAGAVGREAGSFRHQRLWSILHEKHRCPSAPAGEPWPLLTCGCRRCPNFPPPPGAPVPRDVAVGEPPAKKRRRGEQALAEHKEAGEDLVATLRHAFETRAPPEARWTLESVAALLRHEWAPIGRDKLRDILRDHFQCDGHTCWRRPCWWNPCPTGRCPVAPLATVVGDVEGGGAAQE